jgi:hypothetical protein
MSSEPLGLHDAPSVAEMVEALREWMQNDVMTGTSGRLQFHARVAANMLGIIERELARGPQQLAAHRERLASLGCADDAELALRIRRGEFDDGYEEVRAVVMADVHDKLSVANPKYLER